jgi:hypothetical protein
MRERDAILAEFDTLEGLVAAIEAMREQGYRRLDAFTPYPAHEVEHALHLERSRLPYVVFCVGALAAGGAYFLQWFLNAYLYPLNVGGRPPHFPLAYLIITFEMGVLFAGFTAFFGVLGLARVFRLWDPVFEIDGFEGATDDAWWLLISARDPRFVERTTAGQVSELSPVRIVRVHDGRVQWSES